MNIAILGHMGRDEAVADRLEGHTLHVIGKWENPGLAAKARASGGEFHGVSDVTNTEEVGGIVQAIEPHMFLTNFPEALGAGVVDDIQQRIADKRMPDLLIPCVNEKAARIESDKFLLRMIIDEIDPKYNPDHLKMCEKEAEAGRAIAHFRNHGINAVIKPRGPTLKT